MKQQAPRCGDLRRRDLEDAIGVIHAVSEHTSVAGLQHETLGRLASVFGTEACAFNVMKRSSRTLDLERSMIRGLDPGINNEYWERFRDQDPFGDWYVGKGWSRYRNVITAAELQPMDRYIKSSYYNEFLRPHSIHFGMEFALRAEHGIVGVMGVYRPPKSTDFNRRDVAMAGLITAGLGTALKRVLADELVAEQQRIIDGILPDLPFKDLLILDQELNVVFGSNNKVGALFSSQNSSCRELRALCKGFFDTETPATESSDHTHRSEQVNGPDGEVLSLQVRFLDSDVDNPRLMLCLEPSADALSPDDLMRKCGLTRREMDVAFLVAAGLPNTEVGKTLGISIYTVQNHLKAVYRKFGIQGRTALVNRLNRTV